MNVERKERQKERAIQSIENERGLKEKVCVRERKKKTKR